MPGEDGRRTKTKKHELERIKGVSGIQAKRENSSKEERNVIYLTFPSTHEALAFEKSCRKLELNMALIPVPRMISSSCGLAARFSLSDLPPVLSMLDDGKPHVESFYLLGEK